MNTFTITEAPILPDTLNRLLKNKTAGAFISFEGWVRNTNEGQSVERLMYECYPLLAEAEGSQILQEAQSRFEILEAACVHRTGTLALGDLAVWIGVTAVHRQPAFEACQYIIDQVKSRVPIWKKEFYLNGDSGWVQCHHCQEMAHAHSH